MAHTTKCVGVLIHDYTGETMARTDRKKVETTAEACAEFVVEQIVADGYAMSTVELGNIYSHVKAFVFGYLTLEKK